MYSTNYAVYKVTYCENTPCVTPFYAMAEKKRGNRAIQVSTFPNIL